MIPTLPKVELGISVPLVPYLRVGTRLSMHARSTGFPFLSALLSLGRDWASVPDRVGVVQDMCCMHACAIAGNIREYARRAGGVSTMSLCIILFRV